MIRFDIRETVGEYLTAMMNAELTHFLGRKSYERGGKDGNHRNGSYGRDFTLKGIGRVEVKVPRDRKGAYKTQVMHRSKQYEEEISRDLSLMFLTGISTRSLSMIANRLIGRSISHTEVSSTNTDLTKAVEKWRIRDLSQESITYLFVDEVSFPMRIGGSIERVPVLVAIGVTETGHKLGLAIQSGDKESASTWRELLKDLKKRGLDSQKVILGIMDGLKGLETVFKEEFPTAKVQRCQVHVARNVVAKVPKKLKNVVADDMRSIFYAASKPKAMDLFDDFKKKWERELPSVVRC